MFKETHTVYFGTYTTSVKKIWPLKLNSIKKPEGLPVLLGIVMLFVYILCNSFFSARRTHKHLKRVYFTNIPNCFI